MATRDEQIVRADALVGRGTCTHVDECLDRHDLTQLLQGLEPKADRKAARKDEP